MRYSNNRTTKPGRKSTFLAVALMAIVVVLLTSAYGAKSWYESQLKAVSSSPRVETIEIPTGTPVDQIASTLQDKQVIRNSQAFMWYIRSNGLLESMKAGTYKIDASLSTPEVVSIITEGKEQESLLTILPGQRLDQIKQKLVNYGYSEAEVDAAISADQYKNHPALVDKPSDVTLEGYIFPESYSVGADTELQSVIRRSLDELLKVMTIDLVDSFKEKGLNTYEAITLASIVLKESSNPEDQKKIAGVFYNRLDIGMQLGSDVTYQYIADITGQERSAFIDSPYNTRKYTGLPPGPIANVTESSLRAVASPDNNDYLYFVAGDEGGKIYYGKTLAEHEANVRQYCIKLCSTY